MASGPITLRQTEGEKVGAVTDFLFSGPKSLQTVTSHETKRHLLLGRKVMMNLCSIIKSRDITLLTKVLIMKAMVSPAVMYRCESWTIKKAEQWRIGAFKSWCWRRLLGVFLDSKEIKQVDPKGNQLWIFTGRMMLKLKLKLHYFGYLMWRTDSLEKILLLGKIEGRKRKVQQKMRQLDNITNSMDMNLSNLWEIVNYLRNRAWI